MTTHEEFETGSQLDRAAALVHTDPAKAIAEIEGFLRVAPGHARAVEALAFMADAYAALQRFPECGFLLQRCVELEPQEPRHQLRLCAFRMARSQFHRAAEDLSRFLDAGGTPAQLERELFSSKQPRAVIRGLRALCEIIVHVEVVELPGFRSMAEIVAYAESLKWGARPEISAPVDRLVGVSSDAAAKLHAAGMSTVGQLASVAVPELIALGFKDSEAESLVDVANAELYLAAENPQRRPFGG